MDLLAQLAERFINLFNLGGATFLSWVTGIIPTLVVLITFVNALISIVGEERMDGFAKVCGRFFLLRYTGVPLVAMFVLCNPMAYTFGRFVEEKYKPAFYDAAVSFCHPITGLFPHANAGELFVYLGIANGVSELGLSLGPLAVRYFIVGLIVILIRGMVTERLTLRFLKQKAQ
ncbi:MAG: PTS glucitol/sorbitol transporter subunit IIC [Synergistaceae bacterium]|jgi:PTS system glucitol/sorbitol-specific IIC component|nr:PTS glucitol/sorbitol transporter subunit IIC [Synergistaceae bacterium]